MTDTAPEEAAEVPTDGKFHYSIGDVEIVLPHAKRLPIGFVRKNRGADAEDMLFLLLEYTFKEGSPELAAIDGLDSEEFTEMLKAWMPSKTNGGVTVGESSAS